jgi:hypothetical protein
MLYIPYTILLDGKESPRIEESKDGRAKKDKEFCFVHSPFLECMCVYLRMRR